MTIQVLDGVLQPSSRILGIELHLHGNVVIHRCKPLPNRIIAVACAGTASAVRYRLRPARF